MPEEYISIWKCPKCGAMHRECRYYEYALAVEIPPCESDGTCSFFCPFRQTNPEIITLGMPAYMESQCAKRLIK